MKKESGPLEKNHLWEIARAQGMGEPGLKMLAGVIDGPPAREPGRNRVSVRGWYTSRKMGVLMPYESHLAERVFIIECERDPNVLAYWAQPLTLVRRWQGGSSQWTPDYLVLKEGSCTLIEVKLQEQLHKLTEKSPFLYQGSATAGYVSGPSAEAAARLGYGFEFWSPTQTSVTATENYAFLDSFMRTANLSFSAVEKKWVSMVCKSSGRSQDEFVRNGSEQALVYKAVSVGALFFAESVENIQHPKTKLFASEQEAEAYAACLFAPSSTYALATSAIDLAEGGVVIYENTTYTVALVSPAQTILRSEAGLLLEWSRDDLYKLFSAGKIQLPIGTNSKASEWQMQLANCPAHLIEIALKNKRFIEGPRPKNSSKLRRYQRLRESWNNAELIGMPGLLALVPHYQCRGRRDSLLGGPIAGLFDDILRNHFLTRASPTKVFCYNLFSARLAEMGLDCPSFQTFAKWLDQGTNKEETARLRKGSKQGYQASGPAGALGRLSKSKSQFVFDLVQIDGTQVNIELLDSHKNGHVLGRPFLTLALDVLTRMPLAHALTYRPPSAANTLLCIRKMAYLHGRLPQRLLVDCGSEYDNEDLRLACAALGIEIAYRPTSSPRFSAEIERMLHTLELTLVHNLLGNTDAERNRRAMAGRERAAKNAVYTFDTFSLLVERFLYEEYPKRVHSTLKETPRAAFERSLAEREGHCGVRVVPGEGLNALTSIRPRGGSKRKIGKSGLHINGLQYWAEEFLSNCVQGQQVHVRLEPETSQYVRYYLGGEWRRAYCNVGTLSKDLSPHVNEQINLLAGREQRDTAMHHDFSKMLDDTFKEATSAKAASEEDRKIGENAPEVKPSDSLEERLKEAFENRNASDTNREKEDDSNNSD